MAHELRQRFVHGEVELAWDRFGPTGAGAGGRPVALCHGFSGSAEDFSLHVDALAERREVLLVEHRGHGGSTKLGRLEGYSLAELAGDLAAWLAVAGGGEPVDLLGHSMGGRLVLEVALAHPELVASLVLMDTSAGGFLDGESPQAQLISAWMAVYDPAGGLPDPALLRGPEDDLIESTVPAEVRARREAVRDAFDPYALKALGSELFALHGASLADRLGEITCPVTVLCGSLDEPLVGAAEQMADAIAGAELVWIEGAYHSPQLTHPAEWRAALEAHLTRSA